MEDLTEREKELFEQAGLQHPAEQGKSKGVPPPPIDTTDDDGEEPGEVIPIAR